MKLSRKEFLSLSGISLMSMTFVNLFASEAAGKSSESKNKSGDVMIQVKTKRLNLAHTWTISRNSSDYKDNVFVRIEKDGIVGIGEAAPNVRYGENAELTTQRIHEAEPIF
ncbi:MAG: hypothetical protein ACE5GL_08695 [Calditrichia bacterium]